MSIFNQMTSNIFLNFFWEINVLYIICESIVWTYKKTEYIYIYIINKKIYIILMIRSRSSFFKKKKFIIIKKYQLKWRISSNNK